MPVIVSATVKEAPIPNQMLAPTLSGDENALTLQIATQPTTVIGATVTGYDYDVTTAADTDFSSPVETGSILPGELNDQITFYPLDAGDYISRNRQVNTAGNGPWSEASPAATVTAASLTMSLTLGTLDVNEFSYTLSGNGQVYRVITNSATAPTAAQVIAGQDHTGVDALSFGPDAVLFGAVASVNDDISSLADGDWWIHLVATNPVAQSTVETLAFTKETTPAVVSASTGATVTSGASIGGKTYDIYDLTDDGTITFSSAGKVELFMAGGGGGGGGRAGGGGAAGEWYENRLDTLGGVEVTAQVYNITVGAGGVSQSDGGDTVFASLTARGGPAGQTFLLGLRSDLDGPSGAGEGGSSSNTGPGVATPGIGLGNDGGGKNIDSNRAGGGGGAGGTGGDAGIIAGRGGLGGLGLGTEITGTLLMMCAGGEGGDGQDVSASGVGGKGETDSAAATGGVDGTGSGGGGGASSTQFQSGTGGKGRVIIRVEV